LLDTSAAIVDQIDRGSMLVGTAINYAHTGDGVSNGTLAGSAHISSGQLDDYNNALSGMLGYQPYGDAQAFLEEAASEQISMMNDAVDVFTSAVVDMSSVIKVAEISELAVTPNDKAEVAVYVETNYEELQITQEEVETYNQSVTDIEQHANSASAYINLSKNKEATNYLTQGAVDNNNTFQDASIAYNSQDQYAQVAWVSGGATDLYVNGSQFNTNMYVDEANILAYGAQTEFYYTSPTASGYECFMNQTNCER
tara:strand:+ start:1454 stop:2218 length:765 start_codon:yes stop_codon:yes gene_type:complete